jgi:hypothetical protein
MGATLAHLARLPVLAGASPFYLPPGVALAPAKLSEAELVRCRLTAMGRDTAHASRDELYTLFVTTRIVNWLKGLSTQSRIIPFAEILDGARHSGVERDGLGTQILERLLAEGVLYAATRDARVPLPRFRGELFRAFWRDLGWIGTQDGGRIALT